MKALIVDDERLARNELRRLLAAHPEIEVAGEAQNIDDARLAVERLQPDLLFLDIQMPGGNGFDLLEQLPASPAVIFTTAYDQFALQAFEANALDYLLKPISPARLAAAVAKVLPRVRPALAGDQHIFVREGERCWFVPLRNVVLFESEGNYTRLYFGNNRVLILRSLSHIQERLDSALFFRASRKHIVNLKCIVSLDPWINGGLRLTLTGGHAVEMSRRQAQIFRDLMSL
jgi:two-component system, LytTR family, response regulator